MITNKLNILEPRFRIYGDVAEFETERQLENFFCDVVISKLGLKFLANQYVCKNGVCDILAKGNNNQLIIIELKNTKDSHIFEQITAYFNSLENERPFSDQVDYNQRIELITVCPTYSDRAKYIMGHISNLKAIYYELKPQEEALKFTLFDWLSKLELVSIQISNSYRLTSEINLPVAPQNFINLLNKCSTEEKDLAILIRTQIYRFSQEFNLRISETPMGKCLRFEKTKQFSIAEISWDSKRNNMAIYLWLPFLTVNGGINNSKESYQRTSMMRIWVVNGNVQYLGYVENGKKSWVVITDDEISSGAFTKPVKLNKWMKYGNSRYWKGLAMPTQFYLNHLKLEVETNNLSSFLDLALNHLVFRLKKSKKQI
jgi:Endonuclease NucS